MRKQREVIVEIDLTTGTATFEGVGFEDGSCAQDVAGIAGQHGKVRDEKRKPEYLRRAAAQSCKVRAGR